MNSLRFLTSFACQRWSAVSTLLRGNGSPSVLTTSASPQWAAGELAKRYGLPSSRSRAARRWPHARSWVTKRLLESGVVIPGEIIRLKKWSISYSFHTLSTKNVHCTAYIDQAERYDLQTRLWLLFSFLKREGRRKEEWIAKIKILSHSFLHARSNLYHEKISQSL